MWGNLSIRMMSTGESGSVIKSFCRTNSVDWASAALAASTTLSRAGLSAYASSRAASIAACCWSSLGDSGNLGAPGVSLSTVRAIRYMSLRTRLSSDSARCLISARDSDDSSANFNFWSYFSAPMRKSPLALGTSTVSSQVCCSATALRRLSMAACARAASIGPSWLMLGAMKLSTMLRMPLFCLATVSAWIFGTRAGSRFSRACAKMLGIFSMRWVAAVRRSGSGANSRAIRLYSALPARPL